MALILRCTGKLAKLLGVRLTDLRSDSSDDDDWYGNLVWIDRRKCLLFTHAETLFSFLAIDVRKGDVSPVGPFFVQALAAELHSEQLPADTFGHIRADDVVVAKTASKSVLGSMNELAYQSTMEILAEGGIGSVVPAVVNHRLRRIPMGAQGYAYPIERARDRVRRSSAQLGAAADESSPSRPALRIVR